MDAPAKRSDLREQWPHETLNEFRIAGPLELHELMLDVLGVKRELLVLLP